MMILIGMHLKRKATTVIDLLEINGIKYPPPFYDLPIPYLTVLVVYCSLQILNTLKFETLSFFLLFSLACINFIL